MEATLYNPDTGKIAGVLSGPLSIIELTSEFNSLLFIEGPSNQQTQMVIDGKISSRPDMPTTLNGNILSNVPVGATIDFGNQSFDAEESEIEVEGPVGETMTIRITCWPYITKEFKYAEAEV